MSGAANFEFFNKNSFTLIFYTLFLFIFDDFLRFFQHYLMHKVPFLWEIHKVHHSAPVLTPLTLYRVHFVEVFVSGVRRVFGTFFITALMVTLTGEMFRGYEILGAFSITVLFNFLGGNLRHSHIPISFGFLEKIFISPAQHQIHHSKSPEHYDKNFGVALSIWDLMAGSWLKGSSQQKLKFGLVYSERNHREEILSSLYSPLIFAFRKIKVLSFKEGEGLMKKAILILSVFLTSCSGGGGATNGEGADAKGMSHNFSIKKYSETLTEDFFKRELEGAIDAVNSIQSKTSSCSDSFSRNDLRLDWQKGLFALQRILPLASMGLVAENEELEEGLFSRLVEGPYGVNSCSVQENMINKVSFGSYLLRQNPYMDSLEVLLYADVIETNLCSYKLDKGQGLDSWFDANGKEIDLCRGIHAVARSLSQELAQAKDYFVKIQSNDGAVYDESYLQKVYDTLNVFTDKVLKDKKVATPLGQSISCNFPGQLCPKGVEFKFSHLSFQTLLKNLEGVMQVYNNHQNMDLEPQAQGLYQFLNINNHKALADRTYNKITAAYAKAKELEASGQTFVFQVETLDKKECERTTLENNLVPLCSFYLEVKEISNLIKNDLRVALALSKTQQTAGDSD